MGGNCVSRRHGGSVIAESLPLSENGTSEEGKDPSKSPMGKMKSSAVGRDDDDGANPDMVAVNLRCSCNIGCIQDEHLQELLKNLYEVSASSSRLRVANVR